MGFTRVDTAFVFSSFGKVTVVNMPRYGCYSQARIAIQLDRYQKDSEGSGVCLMG
jgi:hypothetical protein